MRIYGANLVKDQTGLILIRDQNGLIQSRLNRGFGELAWLPRAGCFLKRGGVRLLVFIQARAGTGLTAIDPDRDAYISIA